MKILLILLMISSSYAYPVTRTWTFQELLHKIKWNAINPMEAANDPEQRAIFDAFDEMMAALHTRKENYIQAILLSPTGARVWTKDQLIHALITDETDPEIFPFLEQAFIHLRQQNDNGTKQDTIEVWVPTLEISTWTENEVGSAIRDNEVKPDLFHYLKEAEKKFKTAKEKGGKLESVKIITPVGVIPKPKGQPTVFVARPVHADMLANKEEVIVWYQNQQREKASLLHDNMLANTEQIIAWYQNQ